MNGTVERTRVTRYLVSTSIMLVIATGLAGCGKETPQPHKPRPVLVVTAHNVSGGYERMFTGVVHARHESDHGFRTGGKVVARMVEVGQAVVAGQPLARLDPADYELAVRAAEDQLQAARADAEQAASDEERFRRLLADNSVSVADHERQKARSDAAAARQAQASRQLELARNRMKYSTLVAEFDGVVTAIRLEAGQVVAEGQPVITVANPSELEVVADLPEEMAGSAHALSAFATFAGAPDHVVALKLRELAPAAAAQTRTFRARFSIADDSPDVRRALHLGITAKLHLAGKSGEYVVVLPATAIIKTNGKTAVWQVDNTGKRLIEQPVEIVRYTDDAVLVRGLTDGARVVSAGIQKLDPGIEVLPVERSASGMNLGMPTAHTPTSSVSGGRA